MKPQFWLDKWQQGKTGFHRQQPLPQLIKYGISRLPRHSRVLVPLCGKTPDMQWLLEQGYRVLGVELSPLAVEQYIDEHGLQPEVHHSAAGTHYIDRNLEIINGNIFDLDDATLARCGAVYDRAAIVALPPEMRARYVSDVYGRLPKGCHGLMVTLEFAQHLVQGPPFSLDSDKVHSTLGAAWQVTDLEQKDILDDSPNFEENGLDYLYSNAFSIVKLT